MPGGAGVWVPALPGQGGRNVQGAHSWVRLRTQVRVRIEGEGTFKGFG